MELILVRHGLPVRETNDTGPADPGLDGPGQRQAEAVAQWLRGERIDAIYSSPMRRAIETAMPLCGVLGMDATILPGLAEFDRDATSYVPMEELQAEDHPEWHKFRDGRWDELGIDLDAFRERVLVSIDQIINDHPRQRVAVFAHGAVINIATGAAIGVDDLFWFVPAYTGISRLHASRDGRRGIGSINETPHLHPAFTDA